MQHPERISIEGLAGRVVCSGMLPDSGDHVNGRDYFAEWETRLKISNVDPDVLHAGMVSPTPLKPGPRKSRVGGRITTDLTRLDPATTDERRKEADEFLNQEEEHFPAEECGDGSAA